jgi:hypothetical protein
MPPVNTQPNVQVTLNGLQMVFVGPQSKKCTVGVLRDVPAGHAFEIKVLKADADGNFQPFAVLTEADIKKTLTLNVTGASQTGISRRKMDVPFDRKLGPTVDNVDSFRWVLDFESEIYSKPIGASKKGFASLLSVNAGELLTRSISQNELIIKRPPNGDEETLGKVATKTGIDIVLDKLQSKAVFKNGNKIIFTADRDSTFLITFERGCGANQGGTDADSYYNAVGDLVPDPQKIRFSATPLPGPNDPDARCMNGNCSQSNPGGS